jgi:AcrR family transcriptional regulator
MAPLEQGSSKRRQQIRSVETRERLIEATLDEIFEVGYHAATTQDIAARANVSRGALLHHFPIRADLVLAAMEELLEDGTRQIKVVADKVQIGAGSLEGFVEFLWQLFSGRFFYLSLEMITEARNDPALRERMIPVVKRFHQALDGIWSTFCDPARRSPQQAQVILNLTLCLVRGMGVQTVLRPEPGYYRELIEAWTALLPQIVDGAAGDAMFRRQGSQLAGATIGKPRRS